MSEPAEHPEYIRDLEDELAVRVAVEREVDDAIGETIQDAVDFLGSNRVKQAALPHIEAEVQLRLRRYGLERKRAGLA